jgi:hypothetical protein
VIGWDFQETRKFSPEMFIFSPPSFVFMHFWGYLFILVFSRIHLHGPEVLLNRQVIRLEPSGNSSLLGGDLHLGQPLFSSTSGVILSF